MDNIIRISKRFYGAKGNPQPRSYYWDNILFQLSTDGATFFTLFNRIYPNAIAGLVLYLKAVLSQRPTLCRAR